MSILEAEGLSPVILDDTAPGVPEGVYEVRVPPSEAAKAEEMIAAIQPMCEQGYEIVREAQSLGASKSLDVVAEVFPTFAMLNPSLVAALELSPQYQQLKRSA